MTQVRTVQLASYSRRVGSNQSWDIGYLLHASSNQSNSVSDLHAIVVLRPSFLAFIMNFSSFQSEVRKTYKLLLEDEDNDFAGFNFNPR